MERAVQTSSGSNEEARMVTLKVIIEEILPKYFNPVPTHWAVRRWFRAAKIRTFKVNERAQGGGGICYYHRPSVERWLKGRAGI